MRIFLYHRMQDFYDFINHCIPVNTVLLLQLVALWITVKLYELDSNKIMHIPLYKKMHGRMMSGLWISHLSISSQYTCHYIALHHFVELTVVTHSNHTFVGSEQCQSIWKLSTWCGRVFCNHCLENYHRYKKHYNNPHFLLDISKIFVIS